MASLMPPTPPSVYTHNFLCKDMQTAIFKQHHELALSWLSLKSTSARSTPVLSLRDTLSIIESMQLMHDSLQESFQARLANTIASGMHAWTGSKDMGDRLTISQEVRASLVVDLSLRHAKRWMFPLFGSVARVSTTRSEVKNSCDPSLYKLLAKDSFKIMTIDLQGQGSAEGRMPVGDVALSK